MTSAEFRQALKEYGDAAREVDRLLREGLASGKIDPALAAELGAAHGALGARLAALVTGLAGRFIEAIAAGMRGMDAAEAALKDRVSPAAVADEIARPN